MIKFKGPQGPWQPAFAWRPRRVNNKWYWLVTIYRRERNKFVWPHQGWEFGDEFDLLKDIY
jgi:hypothetical protein